MKISFEKTVILLLMVSCGILCIASYSNYNKDLERELNLATARAVDLVHAEGANLDLLSSLEPLQTAVHFRVAELLESLLNELGKKESVTDRYWLLSDDGTFFVSNTQGPSGPLTDDTRQVSKNFLKIISASDRVFKQHGYSYSWDTGEIQVYRPIYSEDSRVGFIGAVVSPQAVLKQILREHQLLSLVPIAVSGQPSGNLSVCRALGQESRADMCISIDRQGIWRGYLGYSAASTLWGILFLFLLAGCAVAIKKLMYDPAKFFMEALSDLSSGRLKNTDNLHVPLALRPLRHMIRQVINQHIEITMRREALSRELAMAEVSSQVAHDIRSPLTALDVAIKHTEHLPEEQRIIIRNASNRIRDIANNLMGKYRRSGINAIPSSGGADEANDIYLLSALLDPMITEKRLQFQAEAGLNIDLKLSQQSYGLFARIQPVEFRRMVSNLVNNAAEAADNGCDIEIALLQEKEYITLVVADNGKGIPPDILPKLGQKGETHGKVGGSGLGLYHARETAQRWGGSLHIDSRVGKGTVITIRIPKAPAPVWFVPELVLPPDSSVVILDDDQTIHQVWQGRFFSSRIQEQGIEIFGFSTPESLRAWMYNNPAKSGAAVYLLDYELLGYQETGLSLAKQWGISRQTILVTSRWEEAALLKECNSLSIRLIPKNLAGLVPIVSGAVAKGGDSFNRMAVLVDDDSLVRMTWEMAAKARDIELRTYSGPAGLMADLAALPRKTPIYIDSELGDGVKGEDFARTLYEKGFINISIETGHPAGYFDHISFIRRIMGKDPPWNSDSCKMLY